MTSATDPKGTILCRVFGHAFPREWVQNMWGGVWVWQRVCRRGDCTFVQRIGEVEYERRYAGR